MRINSESGRRPIRTRAAIDTRLRAAEAFNGQQPLADDSPEAWTERFLNHDPAHRHLAERIYNRPGAYHRGLCSFDGPDQPLCSTAMALLLTTGVLDELMKATGRPDRRYGQWIATPDIAAHDALLLIEFYETVRRYRLAIGRPYPANTIGLLSSVLESAPLFDLVRERLTAVAGRRERIETTGKEVST